MTHLEKIRELSQRIVLSLDNENPIDCVMALVDAAVRILKVTGKSDTATACANLLAVVKAVTKGEADAV